MIRALGLLVLSLVAPVAFPQQTSPAIPLTPSAPAHQHSVAPTKMINGKDHPELIPDTTAYRLFFIAAGELPNASDDRRARQKALLSGMPLSDQDLRAIIFALENFKVQYAAMIDEFNAAETLADKNGTPSHNAEFVVERDRLVESTRDRLKQVLSAQTMSEFHAHIQQEKRGMQISAPGGK
jgi:hypothetical protein